MEFQSNLMGVPQLVPGSNRRTRRGPKEDPVSPGQAGHIGGNHLLVGLSSAENNFLEHFFQSGNINI